MNNHAIRAELAIKTANAIECGEIETARELYAEMLALKQADEASQ